MLVTIAICTYNRARLLEKCLKALVHQLNCGEVFVMVIDNKSTDATKAIVEKYQNKIANLIYIYEEKQGLAHARNRAYTESKTDWIAYLDDDGIPHPDYIKRLLYVINDFDFDCFGGMYYAYYEDKKPKWIAENFGTKKLIIQDIDYIEQNTLSGGIFNVKRSVLEELNGFDTAYGMSGNKMAYGEESELQYRIRAAGYTIGFDPYLKMDHIVSSNKLVLSWHLKRIYTEFRDSPVIRIENTTYTSLLKESFKSTFKKLPKLLYKVLKQEEYYIQNMMIHYLKPILSIYGTLKNPLRKKK